MAYTDIDIETGEEGEEEEEGNKTQKEQEEELQRVKKKQVLYSILNIIFSQELYCVPLDYSLVNSAVKFEI